MPLVPPERSSTWPEFVQQVSTLGSEWVFRGDLESGTLVSALERACQSWGVPLERGPAVERQLMREFQRHPEAHGLGLADDDDLSWYAAMQHYGTPTRLLDWTYSPFVAAHFAFDALLSALPCADTAVPPRAAVWALDTRALSRAVRQVLSEEDWALYQRKDSSAFSALYVDHDPPLRIVGAVNPVRLHERLSLQQGVFLCPGDARCRWVENLHALPIDDLNRALRLLVLDLPVLEPAFRDLARMNVTARSLFPGLDGYARSLLHRFRTLADQADE
jgi:hypothetical protein